MRTVVLPEPVGMVTMAGFFELKKWEEAAWMAAICASRKPVGRPLLIGNVNFSQWVEKYSILECGLMSRPALLTSFHSTVSTVWYSRTQFTSLCVIQK